MRLTRILVAAILATATVATIGIDPTAAETVTQIPGGGWVRDPVNCTGAETLVAGPATPPEGGGSLELSVAPDNVACVVSLVGLTVPLASLSGTWWTFIAAGQPTQAAPNLKFRTRLPGFSTVVVEPFFQSQQAAVTGGVWQQWTLDDNALVWGSGTAPCTIAAPCPFAQFKQARPNATVQAVELGVGSLGSDIAPNGAAGNVDAVHLRFAGGAIDSDFEVPVPPKANPDAYATGQGQALAVPGLAGVLVNDVAMNQHPMTAALASTTANGTLTFNSDGGFTYTPNAAFSGTDSFTYTATDAVFGLTSAPATVTITVTPSPPSPQATPAGASTFTALAPHRLVDTRTGLGGVTGSLAAQSVTTFTASGGGVPAAGVTAVVLNVTATESQASGYIQVFPAGAPVLGSTSSVNLDHGLQTISNTVIVGVDASSRFSVFTQSTTHLVVDVFGYFTAAPSANAGRLVTVDPIRVLDTRAGIGAPAGKVAPLGSVTLPVTGAVPADAAAVVMTLTADQGTAPGYVQVIPTGGATALGASSNLNIDRTGETMANTVIVPLGAGGSVTLFTNAGAHLVADVVGYFTGANAAAASTGLFVPVTPVRAADSRVTGNLVQSGATFSIPLSGRAGVPAPPPSAVAGNLTATDTTASGYVQLIPTGSSTPIGSTSTLNINGTDRIVAAANIVSVANGAITAHNQSATHLIYDVTGYFT